MRFVHADICDKFNVYVCDKNDVLFVLIIYVIFVLVISANVCDNE